MNTYSIGLLSLIVATIPSIAFAWEERWSRDSPNFFEETELSDDGFLAVAGTPQDNELAPLSGAVFVYDNQTGVQLWKLKANDADEEDRFGRSVAISGDGSLVAAGAPYEGPTSLRRGSVYLFDPTTGQQLQKLTPNDPHDDAFFGWSVALNHDGSILLVGAQGADDNQGAAYVFDTASGTQLHKFTGSQTVPSDNFGRDVSISDDGSIGLIGSYREDLGGVAYLFNLTTGTELHRLQAADDKPDDLFGFSVSLSGDGSTALVGAYGANNAAGNYNRGTCYLFDASTGAQLNRLVPSDPDNSDNFGFDVAINNDGSTAVVGARGNGGAVYVFVDGMEFLKLNPTLGDTQFGHSVAINGSGDIAHATRTGSVSTFMTGNAIPYFSIKDSDGDGKADILWRHQADGRTRLYFMDDTQRLGAETTDFTVASMTWQAQGLGDFDGDGRADILWRRQSDNKFVIYFMDGETRLGVASANFVPAPNWKVLAVQDFNNDGKADIYMRHQVNGSAIIHLMDGATRMGPGIRPNYHIRSFTWRPVGAADVNRDGQTDVVWRNSDTGKTNIHFLDANYHRTGYQLSDYSVDPLSWGPGAVADYNHDGSGDILFRNIDDGRTVIYHHTQDGLLDDSAQTSFTLGAFEWELRVQ